MVKKQSKLSSAEPLLKENVTVVQNAELKGFFKQVSPNILEIAEMIDFTATPLPNHGRPFEWSAHRAEAKRLMSAVRQAIEGQMLRKSWRHKLRVDIQAVQQKEVLMGAIQAADYLNKVCWHSSCLWLAIGELEWTDNDADTLVGCPQSKQTMQAIKLNSARTLLYMMLCAFPADEKMKQLDSRQLRRKPPLYDGNLDYGVLEDLSQNNSDDHFEMKHPVHLEWFTGGVPVFTLLVQQCAKIVAYSGNNAVPYMNPGWAKDLGDLVMREWRATTAFQLLQLQQILDDATMMQNKMVNLTSTAFLTLVSIAMKYFQSSTCE